MESPQGLCRVDCVKTQDITDVTDQDSRHHFLVCLEDILADAMAGHISEESGHQKKEYFWRLGILQQGVCWDLVERGR